MVATVSGYYVKVCVRAQLAGRAAGTTVGRGRRRVAELGEDTQTLNTHNKAGCIDVHTRQAGHDLCTTQYKGRAND